MVCVGVDERFPINASSSVMMTDTNQTESSFSLYCKAVACCNTKSCYRARTVSSKFNQDLSVLVVL